MLVGQVALVVRLLGRADERAARALGVLGAVMVAGYLAEQRVRQRLVPTGWDVLETPLIVAGGGLAATMAALGLRTGRSA
jgi:hypothetical protein